MSENVAKLIESVDKLTVLELNELVKALEEKFGVSAAAPVMVTGNGATTAPAEAEEEKSEYTVVLADAGANKIGVIKAVREINNTLGLVEAKTLVESTPKNVLENAKKEDAQAAKAKLEAAGAKVELK